MINIAFYCTCVLGSSGCGCDFVFFHTHNQHDDVIKWKHFPRYWPFVRGIQRSPVNSTHKGQWRGALMFSLIWAWINGWINNHQAGDLRRYRAHYDVIVVKRQVIPYYSDVTWAPERLRSPETRRYTGLQIPSVLPHHRQLDCMAHSLSRPISKETAKLRITGIAESLFMLWCHQELCDSSKHIMNNAAPLYRGQFPANNYTPHIILVIR